MTLYFELERGTRKGEPISAYLFILALEVIFTLIIANPNIKGLQLFSDNFLFFTYADDTTFFLRNEKSVLELVNTFGIFSFFVVLKSVKKSVKLLVSVSKSGWRWHSGMECINLTENTLKVVVESCCQNSKHEIMETKKKYIGENCHF